MTPRKSAITLLHVDDFGLSLRAYSVLVDLEVEAVSDLVRLSPDELLGHQRNFGRKTVAEIEAFAHLTVNALDLHPFGEWEGIRPDPPLLSNGRTSPKAFSARCG